VSRSHVAMGRVLGHPYLLASLALLVVNDHLLKGSGLLPGALTGKLSDVAGMFVAPALLAFLARVRTARGVLLAHVGVGVGFTALELSETATSAARAFVGLFGMRWHATSDWTDLLTLVFLVPSALLAIRVGRSRKRARAGELVVAAAAAVACVATSDPGGPPVWQPTNDNDLDGFLTGDDCNDFDAAVNPAAGNCPGNGAESCDDGFDNNADGLTDCDDPDCFFACADTGTACQTAQSIALGQEVLFGSTVVDATWAVEGSCGGADAPEAIFVIDQATLSSIGPRALVLPVPPGHVAYTRLSCIDAFDELTCVDPTERESDGLLTIELQPYGPPLTLIIDAVDPFDATDFEIPLTWPRCGDGVLDPEEECDDGNQVLDDGCDPFCVVTTCPTFPELPTTSEMLPVSAPPWVVASCNPTSELAGDHVFSYTAPSDGTLSVQAQAEQHFVFVSTFVPDLDGCVASELSCAASSAAGQLASSSRDLLAGETVLVVVEVTTTDYLPDATFTVSSTFTPSAGR
jgi:cysteine-rich repeat protein